ncbi:hypothetical protein HNR40_003438 [Nonomuraea endophytica]|uniref:Uncharacterized protein n=1 Tax=Nonomuraea endophytica TaxID=714136 RepID=A0A7W8EG01_9ACTN|nr:hypothetical protein [Nonomuraea endophytica]
MNMAYPERQFGMVVQRYAGSVARQGHTLSLDARLLLTAMARANNTGHAIFNKGELREILSKRLDGRLKPASRSTVYATLKKLRDAGLVLPGGGETCVWLPRDLWERKLDRGGMCPAHHTWESQRIGWDERAA